MDDLGLASLDQLPVYDSAQAQANAFARLGEDDPSLQMDMALEGAETAETSTSVEGELAAEVPAQATSALSEEAPIFELSSPRDPAPTGDDTHEH